MKNTLSLSGSWQLCRSDNISDIIIAQIPGEAGQAEPANEVSWLYKRKFAVDDEFLQKRTYLEFDGLGANAAVALNGHKVGHAEGGLILRKLDVTDAVQAGSNNVEILFEPGHGICRDIRLVSCDLVSIENIHIETETEGCWTNAWIYIEVANHTHEDQHVMASVVVSKGENREKIEVDDYISPFGGVIEAVIRIEEPELWWPNGMGEASLYTCMVGITCEGEVHDAIQTSFGVRDIRYIEHNGALLINGEKVFIKAADWTNASPSPAECYNDLVKLAKEANVNQIIVRGKPESAVFYQACDEMGIMVCQAMPTVDKVEDVEIVLKALRNHPSVVAWIGDDSVQAILRKFDRTRPLKADADFTHDIDVAGPPEIDSLRKFIPEDQLFLPDSDTMKYHGCSAALVELTKQRVGEFKSPEQFAAYAGILQGELLKAEIESRRCSKWERSSIGLGIFNDPSPAVSSSLVDSFLRPKPAYYYAGRAFENVIVSIRQVDDRLQVYVCTDDRLHGIDGRLKLGVMTFDACGLDTQDIPVKLEANSSAVFWQSEPLGKVFIDPPKQCFVAMLEVGEEIIARGTYFALSWSQIQFPLPKLLVHREQLTDTTHELVIAVDSYARNIVISNLPPHARPSDNYFDLLPGEQKTVLIRDIDIEQANDLKLNLWGR